MNMKTRKEQMDDMVESIKISGLGANDILLCIEEAYKSSSNPVVGTLYVDAEQVLTDIVDISNGSISREDLNLDILREYGYDDDMMAEFVNDGTYTDYSRCDKECFYYENMDMDIDGLQAYITRDKKITELIEI